MFTNLLQSSIVPLKKTQQKVLPAVYICFYEHREHTDTQRHTHKYIHWGRFPKVGK